MITLSKHIPHTTSTADASYYKTAPFYNESYTFKGFTYYMDSLATADDLLAEFETDMANRPLVDQHYGMIGLTAIRENRPFTFNAITLMHRKQYDNECHKEREVIILYPSEASINNFGYIKVDTFGITHEDTFGIAVHYICTTEQVKDGEINLNGVRSISGSNYMPSCQVFLNVDNLKKELNALYRTFDREIRKERHAAKRNVLNAYNTLVEIT